MKTTSEPKKVTEPDSGTTGFAWKSAVESAVETVSERTGLQKTTVKAGLLFGFGLVAGLLLRSRR